MVTSHRRRLEMLYHFFHASSLGARVQMLSSSNDLMIQPFLVEDPAEPL